MEKDLERRIVIGLSGASGVELGIRLIAEIPKEFSCFVVATDGAQEVLKQEVKNPKKNMITFLSDSDIGACIASGSFICESMIIAPCSMNTLAKIAVGISDNLTTRAASVFLKERRRLILAPREMPYSTIALEHMQKLSNHGVLIAPPVGAYYANIKTLEDMESFWVGKWLDLLQIPHQLFTRWE